jgi:hypothetical protein
MPPVAVPSCAAALLRCWALRWALLFAASRAPAAHWLLGHAWLLQRLCALGRAPR